MFFHAEQAAFMREANPGIVRRLRLILSLFSSLFFVVIFNVVFEVSLWLRGSLSARSANPNRIAHQPLSLPTGAPAVFSCFSSYNNKTPK
jgi:hypothetical protein